MKKKYIGQSTMTANVSSKKVWNLWKDVNNWNKWDEGIQSIRLEGNFQKGGKVFMIGDNPDEIQIEITDVKEEISFSDITKLPFGSIKTHHEIERLEGGNIKLTHKIEAYIEGEKENDFFSQNIWPEMQKNLSNAVFNILKLAN
ncbi:SRPBCC family protein [Apibacter sp. B2966]|uniref:SRPBCC family protein n=1 Tax=Apibacter sp. B2966 TaxID=2656761 RepID=UPI001409344A|nr:SRPBCC family protein [Apibacter sp. B2966]QII72330.1 hypothetical protein G8C43_05930 [Apibacter sp. B2966]